MKNFLQKNGIELAIVRNLQIKIIQKEVAELIDMKYKTVAFYANNKLIIPEFANPTGRGTTRIYSRNNLIEFLGVRELGKIKVINIKSRRKENYRFQNNCGRISSSLWKNIPEIGVDFLIKGY